MSMYQEKMHLQHVRMAMTQISPCIYNLSIWREGRSSRVGTSARFEAGPLPPKTGRLSLSTQQ